MNKLLTLALCALIPLAAFAAEPAVSIANTGNVYVDGVNVGAPVDAIANNAALAPSIQTALSAFVAQVQADATSSVAAATAAKESEKQAAIIAAQDSAAAQVAAKESTITERDATIATHEATIVARNAYIEALKAQIVALGAAPVEPPSP